MRARGTKERGATIPLVALLLPMLVLMTAFAVDLGRQRSDRRLAQAGADVVALDMMRVVEGRAFDDLRTDPATSDALSRSAQRNGFENAVGFIVDPHLPRVTNLEWGEIPGDDEDGSAFVPLDPLDAADGPRVPTAVRITTERTTDYFFQPGERGVTRQAIATEDSSGSFQLGTRLASVSTADAALLNSVLGPALRGVATLDVLDYQGLLGAEVHLGRLAAELGFASPDELADASVDARRFYQAAATVMQNQGDTAAASAFNRLSATADSSATLAMGNVLQVEQGGSDAVAGGSVNAFSLVQGSAYAINGTSTLSVPSLGLAVPGIGVSSMALDVTERPRIVSGREGVSGSTRQAGTTLTLELLDQPLAPGFRVSGLLTLQLQLAGGTGRLSDVDCGRPGIVVALSPRPVTTTETLDLTVRLLGVPVARITGQGANVTTQGTANGASFLYTSEFLPDVGAGDMVPSNTTSLGLAGASNVTAGNVESIGPGPGIPLSALAGLLNTLLNPVLNVVDNQVITRLDRQLGLNIGGADIGAIDMRCRSIKLVG